MVMKEIELKIWRLLIVFALIGLTAACRKDLKPIPEQQQAILPADPSARIKGFYVVNEGNMNMNKASLDYLDYTTGIYRRNLYNEVNPEVVKGLGDVANDIGVYGSKLYVVVNVSNKIEVLNAKTGRRIGQINLTNCRYITFKGSKAFVSAYLGKVGDPTAANGIVAEIDTATLSETRRIEVGRQPEEMAIVGQKLYVANSGGYSPKSYERTVSVIDLSSLTQIKKIDVDINLHRLKADQYGDLYVTSRGNYYDISSKLFVIDTKTDQVKKVFDIPVGNLTIEGDVAYFFSTGWNYNTGKNTTAYGMLNIKTEVMLDKKFITDGTDHSIAVPYGIAVHPITKEVLVTDAGNYVAPGKLYCFDINGKKKWSVTTGDIPAHIAFIYN